jgi:hypothetical protein
VHPRRHDLPNMTTDHPDVLAGMDPADIYGWIEHV